MAKATHNGTCQVCGRQQAVTRNGLAKHGYTVDFGFFNGTCMGSGELPLEQSTSVYDHVTKELGERAEALEAKTLEDIKTVQVRTRRDGQKVVVTCENDEQVKAVECWNSFEQLAKSALRGLHNEARLTRRYLEDMAAIREARHGQDLIEREQKPVEQKARFFASTMREAREKQAELEATGRYSRVTTRRSRYGEITITATLAA